MPPSFPLYKQSLTPPVLPAATRTIVGYTKRVMTPVGVTAYSGQRTLQTYMATVEVVLMAGQVLHDLSDFHTRHEAQAAQQPYQAYHLFTTSFTSPNGDDPFKHGDQLIPTNNVVGLTNNTAYFIRGVQPYPPYYIELMVERKL